MNTAMRKFGFELNSYVRMTEKIVPVAQTLSW